MMDRGTPGIAHNRVPTVQVEIPAPLAEALLTYGDELLEALRGQRQAAIEHERQARQAANAAMRAEAREWGRRVWHYLRRHQAQGETLHQVARRLEDAATRAHPHPAGHHVDARTLAHLAGAARREFYQGLDRRHAATVARLSLDGWTRPQIADRLRCSTGRIDRLRRDHPDLIGSIMRGDGRTPGRGGAA
jgi:hypothetical protein